MASASGGGYRRPHTRGPTTAGTSNPPRAAFTATRPSCHRPPPKPHPDRRRCSTASARGRSRPWRPWKRRPARAFFLHLIQAFIGVSRFKSHASDDVWGGHAAADDAEARAIQPGPRSRDDLRRRRGQRGGLAGDSGGRRDGTSPDCPGTTSPRHASRNCGDWASTPAPSSAAATGSASITWKRAPRSGGRPSPTTAPAARWRRSIRRNSTGRPCSRARMVPLHRDHPGAVRRRRPGDPRRARRRAGARRDRQLRPQLPQEALELRRRPGRR